MGKFSKFWRSQSPKEEKGDPDCSSLQEPQNVDRYFVRYTKQQRKQLKACWKKMTQPQPEEKFSSKTDGYLTKSEYNATKKIFDQTHVGIQVDDRIDPDLPDFVKYKFYHAFLNKPVTTENFFPVKGN